MARASPILTNFTGGEFSPRLAGRVDFRKYFDACKTLQNMIIHPHGGATRRPGTYFVAEVRYPLKFTRGVSFEYSTEQAYFLEFGDQYIRVYKDNGAVVETAKDITAATQESPVKITSAGHGYNNGDEIYIDDVVGMTELNGRRFIVANKATDYFYLHDKDGNNINGTGYAAYVSGGTCERVYQITTSPYLEAELPALQFAQSADTMYIAHPNHPPMKLTRTAHTSWTLTEVDYLDGPYLLEQTGGITPSATSGSVTLTSDTALFTIPGATGDVNRLIRLKNGSTWYWCKITAVTDSTHATATIRGTALPNTNKITTFRMGYWSNGKGYPGSVNFLEQRIWWAGSSGYPQALWASRVADYDNFSEAATAEDDDPITYLIASDQVNAIRWLSAGKVLFIGTTGGEFIATGATTSEPITPSSIQIKRETTYGGALVMPQRVEQAALFLQRSSLKIREMIYSWESDGYLGTDLTLLAEHITRGGITCMAYQQSPDSILWCIRADGIAPAMTFEKAHEVVGWHRHITDGEFESFAVIPASNHDQLWMIVKRTIDEVEKRYVEYMKPADWGDDQKDCFFVDCGLTYDSTPTTTISGLEHLEGKSAAVLADGATHKNCTVTDGAITLDRAASVVHVGLPYTSTLETMDLEAGAAEGTSQGKIKRPWKAVVRLYNSGAGCKVGPDATHLETISAGPYTMDEAPPLFTGLHEVPFPAGWNMEARVMVTQDLPLPLTVLAIMPRVITSDA